MAQEELLDKLMNTRHLDDCRVLFALLKHVESENAIAVSQVKIARLLQMSTPQVNRAIKRLIELKVLLKEEKEGMHSLYRLSPELGWKGSGANHKKELEAHRTKGEKRKEEAFIYSVLPGGKSEDPAK